MKTHKPINLNIFTIKFIKTAIASILHRISGIITFLIFSVFIYCLELSLCSQEKFNTLQNFFYENVLFKFFLWAILTIFTYHTVFGLRHILIDFNFFKEDLKTAKMTVNIALLVTATISIILGFFLW
ncbi:cytochrome b556-binding succinate dehydrogenase membrane subunit [Wigglesworthia glossinidia endosymbiont of Glossina morsitans morsitans (Yale colony)]|uniref:Succinate dehydrogenase cytochrome b556 subunit n=1 Tax=Wigglesworthia glossinidia endosymbiont of Glossina morsitans morsitans (Yale colony) TaxID=1142511 RepID=H6Q5X8_WIGGL|nr:succinate dehydrogenase, cytochrome b556 subunit [Wigglesworthia glossinidia]AFA41174.1 cytochrome b556-binding succinate dehydrogenase membrane subunit [Wigglesworthia glossinidia endosymbiont of Glossina morsitans morsitans (Yale colony)]